eukprot:TRINITY_DN1824_c0_g1_i2.p2 TRINITY_DN1824_c0_g1~~TRINITY_DN1824_c0_g1_i2.p2  ORF type:complete len:140 (+),score=5.99 TRINITY_DN1824_c0_g1_i2:508-927(+)
MHQRPENKISENKRCFPTIKGFFVIIIIPKIKIAGYQKLPRFYPQIKEIYIPKTQPNKKSHLNALGIFKFIKDLEVGEGDSREKSGWSATTIISSHFVFLYSMYLLNHNSALVYFHNQLTTTLNQLKVNYANSVKFMKV